MKIIKKDIDPICPYCEKKLTEIIKVRGELGFFSAPKEIYCCQHCHKILGLSSLQ